MSPSLQWSRSSCTLGSHTRSDTHPANDIEAGVHQYAHENGRFPHCDGVVAFYLVHSGTGHRCGELAWRRAGTSRSCVATTTAVGTFTSVIQPCDV